MADHRGAPALPPTGESTEGFHTLRIPTRLPTIGVTNPYRVGQSLQIRESRGDTSWMDCTVFACGYDWILPHFREFSALLDNMVFVDPAHPQHGRFQLRLPAPPQSATPPPAPSAQMPLTPPLPLPPILWSLPLLPWNSIPVLVLVSVSVSDPI